MGPETEAFSAQSPLAWVWLGINTAAVSRVRLPNASRMLFRSQLADKTPTPTATRTVEQSTKIATNAFKFGPPSDDVFYRNSGRLCPSPPRLQLTLPRVDAGRCWPI